MVGLVGFRTPLLFGGVLILSLLLCLSLLWAKKYFACTIRVLWTVLKIFIIVRLALLIHLRVHTVRVCIYPIVFSTNFFYSPCVSSSFVSVLYLGICIFLKVRANTTSFNRNSFNYACEVIGIWLTGRHMVFGTLSCLPRVKLATESTHSVQVWATMHDAGPMAPTGLGYWTHFWWVPPPGPVGHPIPWAFHEGQPLYIHGIW